MALSSGLTLTDLSDYLAPSQLCIKPVSIVEEPMPPPPVLERAKTEIRFDKGSVYELSLGELTGGKGVGGTKLKKAEITLNDCLACSGCITSAESVLVSLQSHEEVYSVLSTQPDRIPILSISPQSLASLSASHTLPIPHLLLSLRQFFRQRLGFRLVFDTTFARELSLFEGRREVAEKKEGKRSTVLSSACPGWICYAEKTHGGLLPLVSATMSSQAVQGVLVKRTLVPDYLGVPPEKIYHVSVMPCYDKKLEASRPDFSDDVLGRETDCVLTTGEVELMLGREGWDLTAPIEGGELEEEEKLFPSLIPLPSTATSSGGYIHNALSSIIATLRPQDWSRLRLDTTSRGADYDELVLSLLPLPSSPPFSPSTAITPSQPPQMLYRAARCYGFRNLQNVVRRVARDNAISISKFSAAGGRRKALLPASTRGGPKSWEGFDFVEIMACPGGCVNGGGQLKVEGKEGVTRVEEAFWSLERRDSVMEVEVDDSVRGFLPQAGGGARAEEVRTVWERLRAQGVGLRTQYRAVEEEGEVNGLAVKW